MANMSLSMPRRRAEVTVNAYWAKRLCILDGQVSCHVLGFFQDGEGTLDSLCVVAVCELDDGRVFEASPETVRFTDTKDGIIV